MQNEVMSYIGKIRPRQSQEEETHAVITILTKAIVMGGDSNLRIHISNDTVIAVGLTGMININRRMRLVAPMCGYEYYRDQNDSAVFPYIEVFKRKNL